jgi:hypothetical protein
VQTALWYLDQEENRGYEHPRGDDFFIASMSVEKSFWDKRGLLFARWENITDEEFTYLALETTESIQLPWQDTLAEVGVRWNF